MVDEEKLRAAITPETKMVWIETPTNPLLTVVDLSMVARVVHEVGALAVADNTFATPSLNECCHANNRPSRDVQISTSSPASPLVAHAVAPSGNRSILCDRF